MPELRATAFCTCVQSEVVYRPIARQAMALLPMPRVIGVVADTAARFMEDQFCGRDIPRRDVIVEVAVETAVGDPADGQSGRADTTDRAGLVGHMIEDR